MKKGKYQGRTSKKALTIALALVMLVSFAIGGTVAWLMDSTETVTNTFSVGNVDIEISETGTTQDGTNLKKDTYKIIPGTSESKDPKVTVKAGSEACWVFVEITETNNYIQDADGKYTTDTFIDWEGNLGNSVTQWTLLSRTPENGGSNQVTYVYYAKQVALTGDNAKDVDYYVLKGDTTHTNGVVSYDSSLTKEQLAQLKNEDGTLTPSLTFKAYAVQSEALTKDGTTNVITEPSEAWALAKPTT